jgi:hypothetical protein
MFPTRTLTLWRVALLVFLVSWSLWFGGVHCRAMIGNTLLQTGTLEFRELLAPDAEREIFRMLSVAGILVVPSYLVALLSGAVVLATIPLPLKEHGWLMMAALLFYLAAPVELYVTSIDARMLYEEFFTTADNTVFRELFQERLRALGGAPLVAMMLHYVTLAIVVFQPMRRSVVTQA